MDYKTYEERLEHLLAMTEKSRLISIQQVALMYSCSHRTVHRMLSHLRDKGHAVTYSQPLRKYYIKK